MINIQEAQVCQSNNILPRLAFVQNDTWCESRKASNLHSLDLFLVAPCQILPIDLRPGAEFLTEFHHIDDLVKFCFLGPCSHYIFEDIYSHIDLLSGTTSLAFYNYSL